MILSRDAHILLVRLLSSIHVIQSGSGTFFIGDGRYRPPRVRHLPIRAHWLPDTRFLIPIYLAIVRV